MMKVRVRVKVKVSELMQYVICPRLVYFRVRAQGRGYESYAQTQTQTQAHTVTVREKSMIESFILKEFAFNLHKITGCEDTAAIRAIIGDIVESVPRIYREELVGLGLVLELDLIEAVKRDFIQGMNDEWLKKLRIKNELTELERVHGYERERMMYSEKLNLSGSVDKLIIADEEVIPCMIKTGKSPGYGVWRSDRVQLAAYAMLIEDEFGSIVKRGFVEYIREAEFRVTQIRRSDRAQALQILKHVRRIKQGAFPDKGRNAPCENCVYSKYCDTDTRKTLLSKLLGK